MPTKELEKQIHNWVEPPKKESRPYNEPYFWHPSRDRCEREENEEQNVWGLTRALRMKAATPQVFRKWTEEDLKIFAEEDELDPERAQRLADFLQTE